jgi:glycosyltransferase involved in cell wall biosynthesis
MKTSRIAYICADPGVPVFGRKGCSIHVQEVIRALVRRGAQVSLFAARFDGAPPLDLAEVTTHPLPCPREGELAAREQACFEANQDLRRLLCATGPFDLVYERYSLWSFWGMNYARANRIPGLLEVNAPLIEEQVAHRGLVNREQAEQVATRAFNDAAGLIAVSAEVGEYLRQRGAAPAAVHVIPNGVNPERFEVTPRREVRREGFTIGFVGTLKPWHGVAGLLEAFALVRQSFSDARLLVVGDGPERATLEDRVRALQLTEVTHFTGAVAADAIPGWLAQMDVAVAPYPQLDHFYFSPLKVYEYMAAGCATIASRIGQLNELIQHEQNGLLCAPGEVAELARALIRLREDAGLRQRLAAAGRDTILRGHTWDHVAGRILELGCRTNPDVGTRGSDFEIPNSSSRRGAALTCSQSPMERTDVHSYKA